MRQFGAAHRACASHAQIVSTFVRKTLSTFVLQIPHLFERRPDWLVVMWSAANVTVQPKAGHAKTLKPGPTLSGWQTKRLGLIIMNLHEVADCTAPS